MLLQQTRIMLNKLITFSFFHYLLSLASTALSIIGFQNFAIGQENSLLPSLERIPVQRIEWYTYYYSTPPKRESSPRYINSSSDIILGSDLIDCKDDYIYLNCSDNFVGMARNREAGLRQHELDLEYGTAHRSFIEIGDYFDIDCVRFELSEDNSELVNRGSFPIINPENSEERTFYTVFLHPSNWSGRESYRVLCSIPPQQAIQRILLGQFSQSSIAQAQQDDCDELADIYEKLARANLEFRSIQSMIDEAQRTIMKKSNENTTLEAENKSLLARYEPLVEQLEKDYLDLCLTLQQAFGLSAPEGCTRFKEKLAELEGPPSAPRPSANLRNVGTELIQLGSTMVLTSYNLVRITSSIERLTPEFEAIHRQLETNYYTIESNQNEIHTLSADIEVKAEDAYQKYALEILNRNTEGRNYWEDTDNPVASPGSILLYIVNGIQDRIEEIESRTDCVGT